MKLPSASYHAIFDLGIVHHVPSWRKAVAEIGRVPAADAMMDQAVPDSVLVEARLHSDGDPTTRPPTDPRGRAGHVRIGTKNVKVVLERP